MPPRALVLINPAARRAGKGHDEVVARIRALGLDPVVEPADDPARVPGQVRDHPAGVDRVIVGGGDGTLNLALQGLVGTGLPLGIVPLGTANNLARTLGLPLDPLEACDVIAQGHRRRIDLGRVNGRFFFTTASIGLSVRITEELSPQSKRRWGPLAYALTAIRVVRRTRPFRARIAWDGEACESRTVQVVVGNGRYYGTALPVAEDATIDDAWLDLYSLEVRHWWQLLALGPALARGRQGEKSLVRAIRSSAFEVRTRTPREIDVDGEIAGRTPARFDVLPRALEVFVPVPAMA